MNNTPNYGYNLPEYLEDADVVILNQNFTAIDKDILDVRQIAVLMYDPNESYDTDDLVGYENPTDHHIRMFRCLEDNVTGVWDSTKWTNTNVAAELLRRSGGGTEVEANPSGSATDYLTKVKIGNTIYAVTPADMTGATSQAAGTHGLVPAPSAGDDGKVLYGDGTWKTPQSAPSNLGDLGDVTLTTPTEGQILTYDGDEWVNTDAPDVDVTKTATGNPIEISDGANAPLVKCVTEITGSQDLHGYDKPWVGGAGKNKFQNKQTTRTYNGITYTINSDGSVYIAEGQTATDSSILNLANNLSNPNIYYSLTDMGLQYDTSYIMNGCPVGGSASTYRLTFRSGGSMGNLVDSGTGVNVNIASDASALNWSVCIMIANGYTIPSGGLTFKPMLRLSTESDPTFAPYSNICPITAYTEGEIEVSGRNLFKASDFDLVTGSNITVVNDNEMTIQSRANQENYNEYITNNSDIWSIQFDAETLTVTGSASVGLWASANGNISKIINISLGTVGTKTHYAANIPANSEKIYFGGWAYSGSIELTNIQIEKGSTATPYEPYTSTTHTTTYPNAIYRGSEDVVNGEVTSEWPLIDLSTLTWIYNSSRQVFYSEDNIGANQRVGISCVCDRYKAINNVNSISVFVNAENGSIAFLNANSGSYRLYVKDTAYTDATTFTASLSGSQFAYELLALTTSSVTPTNLPIKSLNGYSHIESSTGDMEIEYITGKYQPIVDLIQSSQHVYSTAEQVVGTWIDGKTLYEKTLTYNQSYTYSNSGWGEIPFTGVPTDIETAISLDIIGGDDDGMQFNDNRVRYMVDLSGSSPKIVAYSTQANHSVTWITAIIRYTKSASQSRSVENLSKGGEEEEVKKVEEPIEEKKEESSEPISEPLETKTDSLSKDETELKEEDESKEIEEVTEEPEEEPTEEEPEEEPVDPEPSKEEADER